jgi:hypothetical protein
MKTFARSIAVTSCLVANVYVDAFGSIPATARATIAPLTATNRRAFLAANIVATIGFNGADMALADDNVNSLIDELFESREKLKQVPDLLKANEWDSVRTILKTPPVNNLWNMGDGKNPLMKIAKATDEFELVELKDELGVALQMCDQLTYDNVFVYYQPGNGKVKVKEPTDLAIKALSQLTDAIDMAKNAVK